MFNKNERGAIFRFCVGGTTAMRGDIAHGGSPLGKALFKYERMKIFVGLDPLIHIVI